MVGGRWWVVAAAVESCLAAPLVAPAAAAALIQECRCWQVTRAYKRVGKKCGKRR